MAQTRLRVYFGPEDEGIPMSVGSPTQNHEVRVALGDIFPLLADAVRSERTWLQDFAQDEVTISQDLYEVILAYQQFRRPSA